MPRFSEARTPKPTKTKDLDRFPGVPRRDPSSASAEAGGGEALAGHLRLLHLPPHEEPLPTEAPTAWGHGQGRKIAQSVLVAPILCERFAADAFVAMQTRVSVEEKHAPPESASAPL